MNGGFYKEIRAPKFNIYASMQAQLELSYSLHKCCSDKIT